MQGQKLEALIDKLTRMDKPELEELLKSFDCSFQMDFTQEFLDSISVERLRHIVLAASLHDLNGHRRQKTAC